jgi:hypothetical protein
MRLNFVNMQWAPARRIRGGRTVTAPPATEARRAAIALPKRKGPWDVANLFLTLNHPRRAFGRGKQRPVGQGPFRFVIENKAPKNFISPISLFCSQRARTWPPACGWSVRMALSFVCSASVNGNSAVDRSARLKRANALTAIILSSLCSTILAFAYPAGPARWLVGFLVGLLWANAFEYAYHRWLLHAKRGFQARFHLKHHATTDTSEEPEHVNLAASPFWVAVMFLLNGAVATGLDVLFGWRIAPGALLAFGLYFILVDEIHWRIHLRASLPPGLRSAAAYHLLHHTRPDARFNIFLPLFDTLLGTTRSERAYGEAQKR